MAETETGLLELLLCFDARLTTEKSVHHWEDEMERQRLWAESWRRAANPLYSIHAFHDSLALFAVTEENHLVPLFQFALFSFL